MSTSKNNMEEEFIATLKLVSGEELVSKVCPCDEDDRMILLLENPVVIKEMELNSKGVKVIKIEPWIKTTEDSLYFIDLNNVITMSEIKEGFVFRCYDQYVRSINGVSTVKVESQNTVGYIASVDEYKSLLERLYRKS